MATKQQLQRAYYEAFRERCFDIIGRQCAVCGSTENLEIDHRDWRTKTINISKAQAPARWEEVKRELKKCQPLCKRCHRLKSDRERSERQRQPEVHGTIYRYMRRKCRCEACIAAYAAYKRAWKVRRGIATGRLKDVRSDTGATRKIGKSA